MMNVQHITIKFFLENSENVNLADFPMVFNSWIQKQRLDELLIDVADYLHVHNGPGLMLIGFEGNYSLDNRAGRLGLLYNRKAQIEGSNQEKFAQAARATLTVAQILEKENGLKFNGSEAQVVINDRLLVPNTAESFAALESDLKLFFGKLYNDAGYSLAHHTDPRERFTVNVRTESAFDVDSLLRNLSIEAETVNG
jgi:hypothetical protein